MREEVLAGKETFVIIYVSCRLQKHCRFESLYAGSKFIKVICRNDKLSVPRLVVWVFELFQKVSLDWKEFFA